MSNQLRLVSGLILKPLPVGRRLEFFEIGNQIFQSYIFMVNAEPALAQSSRISTQGTCLDLQLEGCER